MRLVFIGECMVEIAPDGAAFRKGFAGDTFNMAWYARQLCPQEWGVDFVSAIGADAISDELAAFMDTAGVGTAHVQRHADRTVGLYMISLKDGERSFSYWRSQSAARRVADDPTLLDAAFDGADVVCLSGITIAVLEGAGRDNLAAALERFRAGGGRVAFDPNIRPRLWESVDSMRSEVMRFAALSDIVLASFDDEATYFGDATPLETLHRYQGIGVAQIIVKNGPDPVLGTLNGETVTFEPEPVRRVVDSTAAGDSFNAGFLVSALSGAGMSQSIAAGAALSREVIQHAGALSDEAVAAQKLFKA
ncbi:sugar kinase [Puniceibacterium sediminis]|uniref:2-keto-3-deoxygluconate kinase n=1 Tax=Puniceibacterium sediminis TaxID=1608407 RepID=A0A238V2E8_9RHOB|nr:sugar kinase [Puniceibacterium sediminis]SNR28321.1 2-keto-3-deoxygluconate kinase [Puniceibacterium sediminis]